MSVKVIVFVPSPTIIFALQFIVVPEASEVNLPQPPAVSAATNAAKLVEPEPDAVAVFVAAE